MTKEQTEFLYTIADSMGTTGIEDFTCKDGEKMREIIKALEQPTTKDCLVVDDCVSRKAVITIIQNHWWNCRDIDKLVKALPPVTPTHGTCKDCNHRDPEDKKCDCGHSIEWQTPRPDNWYCADFEKRGD